MVIVYCVSSTHQKVGAQLLLDTLVREMQARQATNQTRRYPLYRPVQGEKHWIDTTASFEIVSTAHFNLLNGCIPGDDVTHRSARRLFIDSIHLRISAWNKVAGSIKNVGVWLVCDHQTNGLIPGITDVLVSEDPLSLQNLTNADRFKIIRKYQHGFVPGYITDGSLWNFEEKIPMRRLAVEYNAGTAATVADIVKNSIYLIVIGEGATGAGTAEFRLNSRITFWDA